MVTFFKHFQGTFSTAGSEVCTTCGDGQVSKSDGLDTCESCPTGEIAKSDHTACEACLSVSK